MTFEIEGLDVKAEGDRQRVVGRLDGRDVYYTLPASISVPRRAEFLVALALLPAMLSGRRIKVHPNLPLSAKVSAALSKLQRIRKQWNPELSIVEIEATIDEAVISNPIVTCSFSGGVDSSHTVMMNPDITHLFHTDIFDRNRSPETSAEKQRVIETRAPQLGKVALFVTTNARSLVESYGMHWNMINGNAMGALLASLGVRRHYLPASYSYRDLMPYGSHPLTDPLWSTEATDVVHDGLDYLRSTKTEMLANHPQLCSQLQVCWMDGTTNCGRCGKCVRTKLVLDLIGKQGPFPPVDTRRLLNVLRPESHSAATFVWDLREFAKVRGDEEIVRKTDAMLSTFMRIHSRDEWLRALAGRRLVRFVNRLRKRSYKRFSARLQNPNDFR